MSNVRAITIYNVTCASADTEYSQQLPPNCRSLAMQARTAVDVRVAFVTGKVATPVAPYLLLRAGQQLVIDGLHLPDGAAAYVGTASSGTVVEIVAGSW